MTHNSKSKQIHRTGMLAFLWILMQLNSLPLNLHNTVSIHSLLIERINKADFPIRPKGGFYVYLNRARCLLRNKKYDCNLLNNRFLKKKSITI